jgi:hypothetical protein
MQTASANAPAKGSDDGYAGQLAFDRRYLYVCIGDNEWRRIAHMAVFPVEAEAPPADPSEKAPPVAQTHPAPAPAVHAKGHK